MTTLPAAGYMNNNARTQGEMKTAFEDQRQFIEDLHGVDSTAVPTQKNLLINGDFRVAQRGALFTIGNNDNDSYTLDRWILLSNGDDIVDVGQSQVVPLGAHDSISLDVETANQKFGICQILEGRDSKAVAGQAVSLSFQATASGAISIDHLRAGVASWTSTEDSVTSDLVSAWNGAGTNPTLATNWAFDNTPASLATLTTAYQTFKIENITVATGVNNVAVFIWVDDVTTTIGEILRITDVQLELGTIATPFERRPYAQELELCKRYFERIDSSAASNVYGVGQAVSTTAAVISIPYVEKRIVPAMTVSAAANFDVLQAAGTVEPVTGFSSQNVGVKSGLFRPTVDANLVAGNATTLLDDAGGSSFIDIGAEL